MQRFRVAAGHSNLPAPLKELVKRAAPRALHTGHLGGAHQPTSSAQERPHYIPRHAAHGDDTQVMGALPRQSPRPKMLLVDLSPLLYIYHFSGSSPGGYSTSIHVGFINFMQRLLNEHRPTHMCFALDAEGGTWRHKELKTYKGQRPDPPDEVIAAKKEIPQLLRSLNMPCVEVKGYEADDIIGTLSRQAHEADMDVVICSKDKDMYQCLRPATMSSPATVTMTIPTGLNSFTCDDLLKKHSITPAQHIDFLALAGDSADNVPGVKGIGPKTAEGLLIQYGSLDAILAASGAFTKRSQRLNTQQGQLDARLSRQLVTLCTDMWESVPSMMEGLEKYRRCPPTAEGGATALELMQSWRIDQSHLHSLMALLRKL